MITQFEIQNPAMFSVEEEDSHYLVAVDIPTIPSLAVQVLTTQEALRVEGIFADSEETQTVFECRSRGQGIQACYKNGVLWLMLPKNKAGAGLAQAQIA